MTGDLELFVAPGHGVNKIRALDADDRRLPRGDASLIEHAGRGPRELLTEGQMGGDQIVGGEAVGVVQGVERRAAAKDSGKTEEQKAAPVLDFCAAKQLWPDFVIVEIYYYAGKVAFSELTHDEQKLLFAYAMEYVTKRE